MIPPNLVLLSPLELDIHFNTKFNIKVEIQFQMGATRCASCTGLEVEFVFSNIP